MTPYKGKLAIFTSFHSYHAYAPYVMSLATTLGVLARVGIDTHYIARPSDFHVERAINNTLTEVMEGGDFTDVLLIDSDESWRAEDVVRLLLHEEEIVGGTYRMKNNASEYVGSVYFEGTTPRGKILADGTALLKANRLAAGFLRIKVSALRKFAAAYPDLYSEEPDGRKIQFFGRSLMDNGSGGRIVSCQDMNFSRLCIEAGIELWLDPMVQIDHWWMVAHHGDYDAELRSQKTINDAEGAFAVVAKMAEEIKRRSS